jgi:hypothetical protein
MWKKEWIQTSQERVYLKFIEISLNQKMSIEKVSLC